MVQHITRADDTGRTDRDTLGELDGPLRWPRRLLGRRAWPAVVTAAFLSITACGDGATGEGTAMTADPTASAASDPASEHLAAPIEGTSTCEDPSGDAYAVAADGVDDGASPEGSTPDFDQLRLTTGRSVYILEIPRDDVGPGGDVLQEMWFRSVDDPELTGYLRAEWQAADGSWMVEAGPHAEQVTEVTSSPRIRSDNVRIPFPADAMDVVSTPFQWAGQVTFVANQSADICPNTDPSDPLAADDLPYFPDTASPAPSG